MGAMSDQSSDISDISDTSDNVIDLCGEEHSRYVDDLNTHWDKQLILSVCLLGKSRVLSSESWVSFVAWACFC